MNSYVDEGLHTASKKFQINLQYLFKGVRFCYFIEPEP